jgi:hypothetical protein
VVRYVLEDSVTTRRLRGATAIVSEAADGKRRRTEGSYAALLYPVASVPTIRRLSARSSLALLRFCDALR